jgi:cytochrome bd-type quinol oxidase subunit 2
VPSDTPFNLSTASSLNGTHLDEPFLVVGKKAAFLLKSICSQRNPSISPRLIAVSTARTTIGQRYHDLDFSAATLSLSSSPSFNLRSLGGLFLASYSGLVISIYPYMVPPSITIWQAAAPDESLLFLLFGAVVLLHIVLGYTAYSYWIFRGKTRSGEGYH